MLKLMLWVTVSAAQAPEDALTEIQDAESAVLELVEQNPEQLDCLTPPRDGLVALGQVAQQVDDRRLEAMAGGDASRAALSARQLEVARVKARQLYTDAEACIPTTATVTVARSAEEDRNVSELAAPDDERIPPDPPASSQFE